MPGSWCLRSAGLAPPSPAPFLMVSSGTRVSPVPLHVKVFLSLVPPPVSRTCFPSIILYAYRLLPSSVSCISPQFPLTKSPPTTSPLTKSSLAFHHQVPSLRTRRGCPNGSRMLLHDNKHQCVSSPHLNPFTISATTLQLYPHSTDTSPPLAHASLLYLFLVLHRRCGCSGSTITCTTAV